MAQKKQVAGTVKINGFPLWTLVVAVAGVVALVTRTLYKSWRKRQNEKD